MRIFIPALKDSNTFFDEIIFHSKNNFVFDNYKNYTPAYSVVLIHWPEQIFNWNEPKLEQLKRLKAEIEVWKQKSKIIYVVHNLERHSGMTSKFNELYNLIERSSDAMIHFGHYSLEHFKKKYKSIPHKMIPHPLYKESFIQFDKESARKKLGIDSDALVIAVPGKIRSKHERKMVLQAFKKLPIKNKVLLFTNTIKFKFPYEFRGRNRLKLFFDVKKVYEEILNNMVYKKPQYFFNYNYLSTKEFSLMISAADVIFIPRIKILNSGNVFLGLTFEKIITGPKQGNVTEVLERFGFPVFEGEKPKSVYKALKQAVLMFKKTNYYYSQKRLASFQPKNVSEEWDIFLCNIIKSEK